ncbi:hypothetical protein EG328_001457 [Venturia inaequalis]|uniref:Uncharacterized protein n=1 Tax=Venturia inaequalis TaxID=5025 RepID=A0A8H3ZBX5_VENIN|nr:hypothetical protein EG328_001457 [Venturia inaequalis]KAE9987732.1 hypothetical protein EG327_003670 [Venturia inaequalis]RDI86506.1 hypothetical protein Vi05172_g3356 [Venturia inaequalis]
MQSQDAYQYVDAFKTRQNPPWLYNLYVHWRELFHEPYKGITNDGVVKQDLYKLQDEEVPIEKIVTAAKDFLTMISVPDREKVTYHVDSPEWRSWSNPEFLLSDKGLRLDELHFHTRDAILRILSATLSPEGYEKAISAMRINHFLGELVNSSKIMNEFSYNFVLFGKPSTTRPWGFSFYGHHLCLNIFFYQRQIIIAPWFTGAEPNEIDAGPHAGTTIMRKEEAFGLQLMQSLDPELQQRAQIYKLMHDPAMPPGRWNKDDQRHLCGAYRCNRTVPYEGITLPEMNAGQKELVLLILNEYLLYLPEPSRKLRLQHILSFESETYFSWIGGFGDDDAFYYRIQNPVIICEFDHHSGVIMGNEEPAKFHIHTTCRMPNRGDYGMALRPLIPSVE